MKVYKFGGASVRDAEGIKNIARIVLKEKSDLVIVVSAFGKTTNALEKVLKLWLARDYEYKNHLEAVYNYHSGVADDLFHDVDLVKSKIDDSFTFLKEYLRSAKPGEYDYEYDRIVSNGEIWSTIIVAEFLKNTGLDLEWIDIRKSLVTDDRFRDANIIWDESQKRINKVFDFTLHKFYLTQGFIGSTISGESTTLGREGSDYTAAILANILDAESVTVWKDVPGLLNADPKWLHDAEKLDEVSYREAVEMTFSGAKVIHPKTIKPLQNKNIPLFVKSFVNPEKEGTLVTEEPNLKKIIPVFVRKENQVLLSLLPKDFSFVMGDNLSSMFQAFIQHGIKVNLVDASAVSINVCVDDERSKIVNLLNDLKEEYLAVYNEDVVMLSVRHYTPASIERITAGHEILLEQRSRSMVRFVVRPIASLGLCRD
ncbi:MAG TPA: aspartate kinase [Bacteroidales bacterium]|nr:aspartate kinase [Bacteroidales bacterium]